MKLSPILFLASMMAPVGAKEVKFRVPVSQAPERKLGEKELTPKMAYDHMKNIVNYIRNKPQTGRNAKGHTQLNQW